MSANVELDIKIEQELKSLCEDFLNYILDLYEKDKITLSMIEEMGNKKLEFLRSISDSVEINE